MSIWQIILLAIVQGITEFLPISSSGHLVVLAQLISSEGADSDVNIVLHVGTLLSILVFYQRRILRLLTEDRSTILLLILGTIPAVLVVLVIELFSEDALEELLESPLLAGVMLCVTGLVLLSVPYVRRGEQTFEQMPYWKALVIGILQAAAILPGLSRSGTTITTGLWVGLNPRSAAGFSFLLAIPAIAGGGVLEAYALMSGKPSSTPLPYLAVGAVVSFLVGLVALWWLVRWIERGKLQLFAWWCLPLGLGVILWQLLS